MGQRVRRLQGGDDPFEPRHPLERLQRPVVRHPGVLRAPQVAQPRVLGADGRIVQAGGDRVGRLDVAVPVLEDDAARALQHADRAGGEPRRVAARGDGLAARLDPDQPHAGIVDEPVEDARRVAAAAHAGDDRGRQPAGLLQDLTPRLLPDDRLELPHHQRVGMRTENRPQQIAGVADVGHPVAHRLVDGVLQGPAAGVDAGDLRAEQPHPDHVEGLARHVLGAHVDLAGEPEEGAGGGRGHPVLSRAGLRHHPALAHPHGQQRLSQGVVDLVGPGVRQVLALEEHAGAAQPRGPPPRLVQRRRPPDVAIEQDGEFLAEGGVGAGREIRRLQRRHRRDQGLGDESSAVGAEVPARVRVAPPEDRAGRGRAVRRRHGRCSAPAAASAPATAARNARRRSGSFTPGRDSTPDDTSTP